MEMNTPLPEREVKEIGRGADATALRSSPEAACVIAWQFETGYHMCMTPYTCKWAGACEKENGWVEMMFNGDLNSKVANALELARRFLSIRITVNSLRSKIYHHNYLRCVN